MFNLETNNGQDHSTTISFTHLCVPNTQCNAESGEFAFFFQKKKLHKEIWALFIGLSYY